MKKTVTEKLVPAGEFKAKCLGLLDEVHNKRQSFVITKRGKPVARVVPLEDNPDEIFGFWTGKVRVKGDIVSPAISPEEWGEMY